MTKAEAENIAWILYGIIECSESEVPVDKAGMIANTAVSAVWQILKEHPKIKKEFKLWKETG